MRCLIIPHVKIAVVDEDKLTKEFVVDVLAYSVNREVVSFDNGRDAWGYINQPESVDIVITGADTPGVSGLELTQKIKQLYPGKTCIVMSDQTAHESQALAFGADAFLSKPFGLNDLFELVRLFVVEADWKPQESPTRL